MAGQYEVFLYDHTGTPQIMLQGWEYLEFSQRRNSPWNSTLRIELARDDWRLDLIRNELTRDWIMEIYRRDPINSPNTTTLVYEGFHRTLIDQVLSSGEVEVTMYNQGYTSLLRRRIVLPDAGSDVSEKSGAAETIMKAFVDDQAINPTDTDRELSGLTNEADAGAGATAAYSARYTILETVIKRLAEEGGVDFGIVKPDGGSVGSFEFQVRSLWGTDRRVGNAAGNPPIIFDIDLDNMEIPIYSQNASDEVTYGYVGGQGEGTSRTIREVSNATAAAVSPWQRIERFIDARREGSTDGLDTIGNAYLEQFAHRVRFTFNHRETAGTRWLEDWGMGDLVTSRYFGLEFDQRIREVTVQVTAAATSHIENIIPEFEDV